MIFPQYTIPPADESAPRGQCRFKAGDRVNLARDAKRVGVVVNVYWREGRNALWVKWRNGAVDRCEVGDVVPARGWKR